MTRVDLIGFVICSEYYKKVRVCMCVFRFFFFLYFLFFLFFLLLWIMFSCFDFFWFLFFLLFPFFFGWLFSWELKDIFMNIVVDHVCLLWFSLVDCFVGNLKIFIWICIQYIYYCCGSCSFALIFFGFVSSSVYFSLVDCSVGNQKLFIWIYIIYVVVGDAFLFFSLVFSSVFNCLIGNGYIYLFVCLLFIFLFFSCCEQTLFLLLLCFACLLGERRKSMCYLSLLNHTKKQYNFSIPFRSLFHHHLKCPLSILFHVIQAKGNVYLFFCFILFSSLEKFGDSSSSKGQNSISEFQKL